MAGGPQSLASSLTAPQLTLFLQCMEILGEMERNDEVESAERGFDFPSHKRYTSLTSSCSALWLAC